MRPQSAEEADRKKERKPWENEEVTQMPVSILPLLLTSSVLRLRKERKEGRSDLLLTVEGREEKRLLLTEEGGERDEERARVMELLAEGGRVTCAISNTFYSPSGKRKTL